VPIAITRLPTPYGGDTRGMELEIPAKRDVYSQDRDRQHPVILMIEPANPDCLVPVDETIAPVVRALWGAGIATFSSCQHDGPVPAAIEMTAGNAQKLCLALDIPASGYAWNGEIAVEPLRGVIRDRHTQEDMTVTIPGYHVLTFPRSLSIRLATAIMRSACSPCPYPGKPRLP